mmetsp:Transcript_60893/g.119407  ORF Transcript_60893/g.119407 Transcript_60893/m.119407 type:complete len:228 (+) Transcript_60893:600-1283(+)
MVSAASTARRIADSLVERRSNTPLAAMSFTPLPAPFPAWALMFAPSMSTPRWVPPALPCTAYKADTKLVESCPELSARTRGMHSNASPNLRIAYWSNESVSSASLRRLDAISISEAPPPATKSGASEHMCCTHASPSSHARSRSLMTDTTELRSTMDATCVSSAVSCSNNTTFLDPNSFTYTLLHFPISSGVAGPMRTRPVAPTVAQRRRMSHLEGVLTTIMPYFSR